MTNETLPLSLDDQRIRIEQLSLLVAECVRAEAGLQASRAVRDATMAEQLEADQQRLLARHRAERTALQSQHSSVLSGIARDYELAVEKALADHDQAVRTISLESTQAVERAKAEWDKTQERLRAEYQATVHGLQMSLREFKDRIEERRQEPQELEEQAWLLLRRRRCHRAADAVPPPQGVCDVNAPLEGYSLEIRKAAELLAQLRAHRVPQFLASGALLGILMLVWMVSVAIGATTNRLGWPWILASGAIAFGVVAILYVILRPIVMRQTLELFAHFRQAIANAEMSLNAASKIRAGEADTKKIAAQQQCDQQIRRATAVHQQRLEEISSQRESRLRELAEQLQTHRKQITEARDAKQKEANQRFSLETQQLQEAQGESTRQAEVRRQTEITTTREIHERSWQRLVSRCQESFADFQAAAQRMSDYCEARFPPWDSTDWETSPPLNESLPALPFGKFSLDLQRLESGLPEHADLRPSQLTFTLPAVLSLATRPSLLLEAWGEGRAIATRAMQNVMLRLLTALPPGKVRFTILDPVGLGQNFSAFMHLADFDEKLINHRIWTETQHINQRLTDLTEHMEDVIQTYLRNEFPTIEEYNRQAGEVAEPFHVLVVANFPAGFSDDAAQRLLSIVQSGARCGVYSMISTDSKLELPRNFDLADLESRAATVQWNGERFGWRDESLQDLPLTLDEPPDDERLNRLIRIIGRKAKDAIRVEVPFTTVACPPDAWWTHDSRRGIEIPLGRAGASKLQSLRLGKGTSQHVLISGKTGSGKSTLLHALIVNTALHYSPEEVAFYLIDFKKGVEFKPYASLHLPHARVIAIESEREFGMSVLERLDQELRMRGDLFRLAGVQDIQGYRDANPGQTLPRVLLIIDEFQEFFTQDDKLAQEAALLLDRLVRQGRAFGIHILLGSQTLAGAYSLARSTLGQMAVRIALQCSEADSHLILSEDNTAARLLNRPGEAIYNDANGLFEGNHPFQVVWLSSQEQENYLEQLAVRARNLTGPLEPAIVFEGNVPAEPSENQKLRHLLEQGPAAEPIPAPCAWLGSAVAIKEPTAATFRRQSGTNLLVVGQQEELVLGMLTNCVISLGATCANGQSPRFLILDGTRAEAAEAGWWRRLADQLPLDITVVSPQETARRIEDIAADVTRRIETGAEADQPIFLIVYNLARFRELRRSDDDLGFGGFGEEKSVSLARQFSDLLRDGPAVGVHSLLWCDTFNTLGRWFDRATLRELDQRVLFQMSANDSSNLMDSPAASRLGAHRAILFSEESGLQEKFRPYGPASPEWLAWVTEQLSRRSAQV